MSSQSQGLLSAARLALAIRRIREERPDADLLGAEPIAVVGIGCRLPGNVHSPEGFWRVLSEGIDTIREVPPDRWPMEQYYDSNPNTPGKSNSRWGGFIDGADLFDPVLFGISPREAASIDPQQRLLLEVAWEAIQNSGHAPESLAGSRTGVFVGLALSDYERFAMEDIGAIHANTCTGSYRSVASGRISFLLDARGPSISVDTACSSSLVAVHQACQSLRSGESDFALAGGVNLHLLPEHYIGLARMNMLAPDGRCKSFDASADGFVPSEGCGLVALKRLSDALADGDRIYAVVRGSATNQDGRSTSLTAPSGLAQREVIAAALRNAHVPPSFISYIETHGTGTALGDPIEVEALAAVVGEAREGVPPCVLGAAKSNFGHLEAASGVTGFIKAVLALHHERIPANLHFHKLNPHISLEGTRLSIAEKERSWPRAGVPRFAGVSSFGFSGTNAHIVIEEAPRLPARPAPPAEGERLLLISARTPAALIDAARQYAEFLEGRGSAMPLYDLCHASAVQRSHYEERLAITGSTHVEIREALEKFLSGSRHSGIARGRASGKAGSLVFVCSGQGSQWAGMGMSLFQNEPVFRAAIEECEEWIQRWTGWSLVEQLSTPDAQSKLADTEFGQPAIFAIQVAMARLFESWGVTPAAVIGHSIGEIAAAHIAGALTIGEATRIAVARGRAMEPGAGRGRMAAVRLPVATVFQEIAPFQRQISIAAVNSPQSTVISGDPDAVEALMKIWQERHVRCALLPAHYAFHSTQMEPFAAAFAQDLSAVTTSETRIPIFSTVLGKAASGEQFDASYWKRNVRATVQFSAAMQSACAQGFEDFLELGPHPVLVGSISEHLAANGEPARAIATLRRGQPERKTLLDSVAQLHVTGHPLLWSALYPHPTPPVPLPGYPYQKLRFWFERRAASQPAALKKAADTVFEPVWRPVDRGKPADPLPGSWIVVGPEASDREAMMAALRRQNLIVRDMDSADCRASATEGEGLIWLAGEVPDENPAAGAGQVLAPAMTALQQLIRKSSTSRFWLVTRGAVATAASPALQNLSQSCIWGMLRSVAMEHPELSCVHVDLDANAPDFAALAEEIARWDGESEIAFHNGKRHVRRLERFTGSAVNKPAPQIQSNAAYLITGGLGAIGLHCMEWLAAHGAGTIVLLSRRAPSAEATKRIDAVRRQGKRVEVRSADVSDASQMRTVFEEIDRIMPPLRGVFHAAGSLDDGVFLEQSPSRIEKVLAAKAIGAWNLHELSGERPLDFFVLFSSIASLTGSPGQSGYAAANAFLDALAHDRQAHGLTALSVNWGVWAGSGMAEKVTTGGHRRVLSGLKPMAAEQCFRALEIALAAGRPQLAVADADWSQWNRSLRLLSPLFPQEQVSQSAEQESGILRELQSTAPVRRRKMLLDYLREQLTSLLKLDKSGPYIDEHQPILRLGMDSLMALEFRNQLSSAFRRPLSATLVFDHPTLGNLADLLNESSASENKSVAKDSTLEDLEALSDAEAEELLKAELSRN